MSLPTFTVDQRVALTVLDCWSCGVAYALPASLLANRRRDGASIYCPNGHTASYSDTTDAARLKKAQEDLQRERQRAQAREVALEDQRIAAERSAAAARGQVTKIKKRIANGVCPCCKRSFVNLHRHMSGQHPDYAAGPATHERHTP